MNANIISALKRLDVASLNYDEWLNVGLALHAEGYDWTVWDDWSKNDSRYKNGECERKWRTFRGNSNPVTGATIIQMAKARGWTPYGEDGIMGWNDAINDDGDYYKPRMQQKPWDAIGDFMTYLKAVFKPDDRIGYVTNDVWQDEEGEWKPGRGSFDRTAGELIESLERHPDDLGATIGDWKPDAGAWIRFNPLDGTGVRNENVVAFRYALVESDEMTIAEQEALYRKLELPIVALVHSGGKSLHAIVHIDAPDYDEYRKRVDKLYAFLQGHGMKIDRQNRNPSRLSRLPGVTRCGNRQYLVATNIGRSSWLEWLDFAEGLEDVLPSMVSLADYRNAPPALPEELIEGILRRGHKMLISGSSKAGKSFLLMELCIALAEGQSWLGFKCRQGKVLYVNLEIDPASCINRFLKIYEALGIPMRNMENIAIWNLRGHAIPLNELVPKLIRRVANQGFEAVVIDPIYKVITGDENNASDMGAFCNQFDRICDETGCSTIYCHHHSKGAQGAKRAMDRASGSGVFARDPDAQLDMIQLVLSDDLENNVCDAGSTGWRMESSLREFANIKPVNFWFRYPIHVIDNSGELTKAPSEGSSEANLSKSPNRTTREERWQTLDTGFNVCVENGVCRVQDIAEYMGVDEKTIRKYVKEFSDEFHNTRGIITRSRTAENGETGNE